MIQWFSKIIENGLNDLALQSNLPHRFVIYADSGERPDVAYDPTEQREREELESIVYGVFDAQPSRMAPIPGITVVNITGTLTVLPELKRERDSESGQFKEEAVIENLLEAFGRENNGRTYEYPDEKDPLFKVSVNFSPVVCGDWETHSTTLGETIPLSMSVYLTAVESGVSSNDVTVYVDGYPVFYESLNVTRQKTLDQFTYERAPINSVVIQHGLALDLVFPLLQNKIGNALLNEILDGSFTTPHSVVLSYPNAEREYLCVLGTSSAPAVPGKNVGVAVSFAEAKKDVALGELQKTGSRLGILGDQFTKPVAISVQSSEEAYLTTNALNERIKAEVGDFKGLEIGKRYTVAAFDIFSRETFFESFRYEGENQKLFRNFSETGAFLYVRMTYGG